MFKNLRKEMGGARISQAKLARLMDLNEKTIGAKLAGKAPFTLPEMKDIRRLLVFTGTLDELFAEETFDDEKTDRV